MTVIDAYDWDTEPREVRRENRSSGGARRRRTPVDRMQADFSWSDPPARDRRRARNGTDEEAVTPVPLRSPAVEPPPANVPDELPSLAAAIENLAHGLAQSSNAGGLDPVPSTDTSTSTSTRASASADALAGADPPGRRTVVIRGHGAERYASERRGYEARLRRHERSGFKPDRVALWAVLLGLALLLGAITSAHAAVVHHAVLHLVHHAH